MEIDANAVFAAAFGAWALVLAWIGRGVFQRLDTLSLDLKEESKKLNQYIIQTETRLAVLEDNVRKV